MRLFNNYELDVAVPDQVTAEHEQEQLDFLRAVMSTRVMKISMRFLVKRGKLQVLIATGKLVTTFSLSVYQFKISYPVQRKWVKNQL